jgi:hypothetical protein
MEKYNTELYFSLLILLEFQAETQPVINQLRRHAIRVLVRCYGYLSKRLKFYNKVSCTMLQVLC